MLKKIYSFLIVDEAENILNFENDLLAIPCGVPTTKSIDEAREKLEDATTEHDVFL